MTKPATIVVLDDDDGVLLSLSSLIRSLGYEVRCYRSPGAFLADLGVPEPDCMISDIQMPDMSGERLQKALLAAGRDFPIIFMTAFPAPDMRARVLAAGARAFLAKPVSGEALALEIELVLGRR